MSVAWRWWRDHFAGAIAAHLGNNAGRFHGFYHTRCTVIADTQFALYGGYGGLARFSHEANRLVVKRIILLSIVSPAGTGEVTHVAIIRALGNAVDIHRLAALLPIGYHPVHLFITDKGTMNSCRNTTAGWQEQHVAMAKQLFGTAFAKNGGNMGETGSVAFMFDNVGEIRYPLSTATEDEMMEAAIEAGAEDVVHEEDEHVVFTVREDLADVSTALEGSMGEASSTKMIWRPQNLIEVPSDKVGTLMKMMETLEDCDDVQNVYANFDISDEDMANLN